MRILIVGASGTIGSAVVAELIQRHEIIQAGRSSGDLRLDLTDADSVRAAFEQAGPLDAVVSTAGKVKFAPFEEMGADDYAIGLENKLMGQVGLVLIGREFVRDGGSFTLTTGVLDRDPIVQGSSASMVNGAINAFVRAAAIEMPRGQPRRDRGIDGGLGAVLPRLRARPGRARRAGLRQERRGRADGAGVLRGLTLEDRRVSGLPVAQRPPTAYGRREDSMQSTLSIAAEGGPSPVLGSCRKTRFLEGLSGGAPSKNPGPRQGR